jgi:uncharacterized membrane protein YczE
LDCALEKIVNFVGRLLLLNVGLFVFSMAIICAIKSGLGLSAWDVFHQGLSFHTPLTIGQASQLTGLVLIVVSFLFGQKPGIGTISNMLFIGLWMDLVLGLNIIPNMNQYGLLAQLLMILLSISLFGLGSGLYVKANMGTGPRDSLMMVLVRLTGLRVAIVRGTIEVTFCFIGWLLGGTVGLGTVLIALGIGPSVELGFKLFRVEVKKKTPAPVLSQSTIPEY